MAFQEPILYSNPVWLWWATSHWTSHKSSVDTLRKSFHLCSHLGSWLIIRNCVGRSRSEKDSIFAIILFLPISPVHSHPVLILLKGLLICSFDHMNRSNTSRCKDPCQLCQKYKGGKSHGINGKRDGMFGTFGISPIPLGFYHLILAWGRIKNASSGDEHL